VRLTLAAAPRRLLEAAHVALFVAGRLGAALMWGIVDPIYRRARGLQALA
jgi:hypothetical protein